MNNGGMAVIGVIVGAILVLLIGLYVFGVVGPRQNDTTINVDTTAPIEVPAAPETTPAEPAPNPEPSATPDPTPPAEPPVDQPTDQPTEPTTPPPQ